RLHPDAARDPPADPGDQVMNELLAMPREWLAATGEIGRFTGTIVRDVFGLRVFRFFGESLRQSGILIVGSTTIIWTLMFILGLQCGIEGAYFTAAQGAPAYSGVFTAWCDLREITPYAVVQQIGYVSSGGYFLIFWQFQNPPDFLYSLVKAMFMATAIVLVACYYGYNASGGPVGVGRATAKSMVLNLV